MISTCSGTEALIPSEKHCGDKGPTVDGDITALILRRPIKMFGQVKWDFNLTKKNHVTGMVKKTGSSSVSCKLLSKCRQTLARWEMSP